MLNFSTSEENYLKTIFHLQIKDENVSTNELAEKLQAKPASITDMMKKTSGRVVCLTSVSGLRGVVGQANYSAAKAGIIGFVHSLAKEVGPFGINVNAIAPGFIETDMIESVQEERKKSMVTMIPLKRFGRAEEVAHLVCFLLSDEACYITGQVIAIDGGVSI